MDRDHRTCAHCGDRIGVYEPLWWQQPGGSIVAAGYLAIITDPRAADPTSRIYHRHCLQPATPHTDLPE